MTTVSFTSAGTTSWLCPAGVTVIKVECWGGGGNGGRGSTTDSGSSGGGGEYAAETAYSVTPGNSYTVTVGGAAANSVFDGTVLAHGGGSGGSAFSPGAGGSGSSASIHFSGGAGNNGFPGQQFGNHAGGAGGGAGGGSSGTGGAGPAGTTNSFPPGGAGGSGGGGAGGSGGPYPTAGGAGSAPGGAGGGGGSIMPPSNTSGGAGAPGQVIITYTAAVSVAAQPAAVTVTALPGTISSTLAIPGVTASVAVAALPGTIPGADTAVLGVTGTVSVSAPPGAIIGPPVSLAGPTGRVIVTALPGAAIAVPRPGTVSTRSERASLVIAGQIELLQGGVLSGIPACAGATFWLASGYDIGVPMPVVDLVGELIVDGERPFGRRASNRTITLPIVIHADDIGTLSAARETLLAAIDPQTFTLTWTRDGGLPLVFDCFRQLAPQVTYSVAKDRQLYSQVQVQFQALPYGRSDVPQQLTFAAPVAGSPAAPPSPVLLDDYEDVNGDNWSASGNHITGSVSAHWSAPSQVNPGPAYTSFFAPTDITDRTVLQHWAGFASQGFYYYWIFFGMTASFAYTLRDSSGTPLQFGKSLTATPAASQVPNWVLVSSNIPQGQDFDYASVVSCSITITNSAGSQLNYTDAYLDDLTAQPVTTSGTAASIRGSVYTLHGIIGTSHAPLALQFQQPPASTPTTVTLSGTGTWLCPAGVTSVSVQATGGGGAGAGLTGSGHGGGGGAGAYAAEPSVAVTPGSSYGYSAGTGGSQGSSPVPGASSVFTGDLVTVTALGGSSAAQGSATGAAGAAAGSNLVAFAGGSGATGSATGGGGGAAASSSGPGASATGATGATGPSGDGGSGASGNGNGSAGGAPGGGGGGASSTSGGEAGGAGAAGSVVISYFGLQPFRTLVAHRPGPDSPANLTPFVSTANVTDAPDGRQYPVPSQIAGVNARFGGTYSMVAVANSWNNPSQPRTVKITVWQTEFAGGPSSSVSVSRTFTPATDISNGIAVIGELTLPDRDIPPDNTSMVHTVGITDDNQSDQFLDVLFLDTTGQTVIINETQGYSTYYIDEPASDRDLGRILGTTLDRTSAISVLDSTFVSGGPLTCDPGDALLFVYSVEGSPNLVASYSPRWFVDRLA